MKDQHDFDPRWEPWIAEACAAAGVDASLVDGSFILDLTREVARRGGRPLAPVAAFIVAMALVQRGPGADLAALRDEILATAPQAAR